MNSYLQTFMDKRTLSASRILASSSVSSLLSKGFLGVFEICETREISFLLLFCFVLWLLLLFSNEVKVSNRGLHDGWNGRACSRGSESVPFIPGVRKLAKRFSHVTSSCFWYHVTSSCFWNHVLQWGSISLLHVVIWQWRNYWEDGVSFSGPPLKSSLGFLYRWTSMTHLYIRL